MKRSAFFPLVVLLICLCAFSFGCAKNAPIQDVTNGSVKAYGTMTSDMVRDAILRAGLQSGWKMVEEKPGMIVATWTVRTHTVVVEIPYTSDKYTIHYRSSINMNTKNGTIHRNYNRWVTNLDRNINAEMQARGSAGGGRR